MLKKIRNVVRPMCKYLPKNISMGEPFHFNIESKISFFFFLMTDNITPNLSSKWISLEFTAKYCPFSEINKNLFT